MWQRGRGRRSGGDRRGGRWSEDGAGDCHAASGHATADAMYVVMVPQRVGEAIKDGEASGVSAAGVVERGHDSLFSCKRPPGYCSRATWRSNAKLGMIVAGAAILGLICPRCQSIEWSPYVHCGVFMLQRNLATL